MHLPMDNQEALIYLLKLGGLTTSSFWIWPKIFGTIYNPKKIMITAECLPSHLNQESDWQSRNTHDNSEWEFCTFVFQRICQKIGKPNIDLLCVSNATPAFLLHCLETRSGVFVATNMGRKVPICLPSLQSDFSDTKKDENRKNQNDIDNFHMANAGMVLRFIEHVHPKTSFDTTSNRLTLRSIKKSSSANIKSKTIIGGMEGFQKCLAARGISERTAKLMSNSRRGSSVFSYEWTWYKWSCWCNEQKVDPFRCYVNYVL